jgi:hypothetical protein
MFFICITFLSKLQHIPLFPVDFSGLYEATTVDQHCLISIKVTIVDQILSYLDWERFVLPLLFFVEGKILQVTVGEFIRQEGFCLVNRRT